MCVFVSVGCLCVVTVYMQRELCVINCNNVGLDEKRGQCQAWGQMGGGARLPWKPNSIINSCSL